MTPRTLVACAAAATLTACGGAPPPPRTPACQGTDCQTPVEDQLPDVAWPELQQNVEALRLTFSPEVAQIVLEPWSELYEPGRLYLGSTWYDVELRQRGQGSRDWPKHSWKTKHPSGQTYDGAPGTGSWPTRHRNFLSEYVDGGYLSDPFSYPLMRGAGVRSARSRIVTLEVNGEYQGVYVEVQEVDDKYFLADVGLDPTSNVYRCGARDCEMSLRPLDSYQYPWEKHTNEAEPWDDLWAFVRALNRTPEHEFAAWLDRTFDVDRLVRAYAVAAVISWSGIDDSGSYLVHENTTGKWTFVPWDLNNAQLVFWRDDTNPDLAKTMSPTWRYPIPTYTLYDRGTLGVAAGKSQRYGVNAHPPFVTLFQRIWDNPGLRNRVLDEIQKMMDGVFSESQAFARIDRLRALIEPHLAGDPWVSPYYQAESVRFLKEYVTRRRQFLAAQIPVERHRGEGGLVINAISPTSFELYNREDVAKDLGGLALTTDLRVRIQQPLAAGTVVPPHGKITLPFTSGADGGEVGIFDVATQMPVDATFYAPLGGRTYARVPDGAEEWSWR